MTIAVRPLEDIRDLRLAIALQQEVLGERAPAIWQLPHLLHVQQSGGFLLGACEPVPRELSARKVSCRETAPAASDAIDGVLIDLLAEVDGYPARRTVAWGVRAGLRNRGIGTRLREIERRTLREEGVDLAYWDVDPLSSVELHIALNKLGGIITGCSRDAFGSSRDPHAPELASDRVRVEWWFDSPRVTDIMEHELALPHQQIGLHEMVVLTKTSIFPTGVRGLIQFEQQATADHVLAEIPENLADLQSRDRDAAIQWRLRSRDCMEQLLRLGYLGVGLIHEGGRSFLLFKKGTRRTELSTIRH